MGCVCEVGSEIAKSFFTPKPKPWGKHVIFKILTSVVLKSKWLFSTENVGTGVYSMIVVVIIGFVLRHFKGIYVVLSKTMHS